MMSTVQSPLIARVCHNALQSPDLDASLRHATEVLGLRESAREGDVVYLTCGRKHHDLQLIAGDRVGLHHIALEASGPEALARISRAVGERGLELLAEGPSQEPGIKGRAIRFLAPGGHVFEIHDGMDEEEPSDYETDGVRPRKYGHITVTNPDRAELESFLEEVLGFVPSDRVGQDVVWMRCNTDHHGIAVLGGADPGLRHFAWEVAEVAELVALADLVTAKGLALSWGPGRHGPGNNVACYHADPVGATHEYLVDIEQIEDPAWRGRDWAGLPNWRNLWGPGNEEVSLAGDFPRALGAEALQD